MPSHCGVIGVANQKHDGTRPPNLFTSRSQVKNLNIVSAPLARHSHFSFLKSTMHRIPFQFTLHMNNPSNNPLKKCFTFLRVSFYLYHLVVISFNWKAIQEIQAQCGSPTVLGSVPMTSTGTLLSPVKPT